MKKLFSLFFALSLFNFSFGQLDVGALTVIAPSNSLCPNAAVTVTVRIKNYSAVDLDMAVDNVTVNANVSAPNVGVYSILVTSGIITAGQVLDVDVTLLANMSNVGTCVFTTSATVVGDVFLPNDAASLENKIVRIPTLALTSAGATTSQTICINSPLTNITYAVGGSATGATVTGLPAGVTGVYAFGVVTISGTPTVAVASPYNYTVTTTGGLCTPQLSLNGSITVTAAPTISLTSLASTTSQSVCSGVAITNIVYTTTLCTGASVSAGALPAGVTGSWVAGVYTISGSSVAVGMLPYTITTTGGCTPAASLSGSITIVAPSSITLTSGVGTNTFTICANVAITPVTFSTAGNVTGASTVGLPVGVTGAWLANVYTLNGIPTIAGVYPYTITTSGGCSPNASTSGTITVTAPSSMALTSAPLSNIVTTCINVSMTDITYSVGGTATGASITAGGLPTGVTGLFGTGVFTISGTPNAAGVFPYTLTSSGGCAPDIVLNGTITVSGLSTMTLSSAAPTTTQTVCTGVAITNIVYAVGGSATSATLSAGSFPTGVTGSFLAGNFTISGTPSVAGVFPYTITTSGGCAPNISLSGSITVTAASTMALTSAPLSNIVTICVGVLMTDITYSVGGSATSASITAGGLPTGVTGLFGTGVFTISGTPTVAGIFPYTLTSSGGCAPAIVLTGTITVSDLSTMTLSSAAPTTTQTVCTGVAITNIVYAVGGSATSATLSAGSFPTGVTGSFLAGNFTISGTPSVAGVFPYTITTSGGCAPNISLSGSITVNTASAITLTSGVGSNTFTICANVAISQITFSTSGGVTGASTVGLPIGVTGTWLANVYTISGTPTIAGIYAYTVSTSGGCGVAATATGTITVTGASTIALTSAAPTSSQSVCINSPITNIVYTIGGSATGATLTGALPTGVTSSFLAGVFTITGSPSTAVASPYAYTVTTTGGCAPAVFLSGTITVNTLPTFALAGSDPTICGASDGSITVSGLTAATSYIITYNDDAIPVSLGTVVTTGAGTYVISALNAGSYDNFSITLLTSGCPGVDLVGLSLVNPGAPDVFDVVNPVMCGTSYTLVFPIAGSSLSGSQGYFSAPNGGGTQYVAGDVISISGTVVYIYDFVGLCTDQENFMVTITPLSVISDKIATPVCSGSAFSLTPSNTMPDIVQVGTTYSWGIPLVTGGMTGGVAAITQTSITGTLTNPTAVAQTATYTVTPRYLTCNGATFTVTVTINPSAIVAAQTATSCSGALFTATPTLPDIIPVGTTFDWAAPVVTGAMTGGLPGVAQTTITGTLTNITNVAHTATYTVSTLSGTCPGSTFTLVVTVNPKPSSPNQIGAACSGVVFSNAPVNGVPSALTIIPVGTTYSWAAPVVTGGLTGGALATLQATVNGTLLNPTIISQTATYTVTPTAGLCTGSTFTATYTISPNAAIPAQTASVCSGALFTNTITNGVPTAATVLPVGTTYDWSAPVVTGLMTGGVAGVSSSTITGTLTNPTNVVQTATYTITPTSGTCSGPAFTLIVTVNPIPFAAAKASSICSGVLFGVTPVNVLPDIIPVGTTYDWSSPVLTGAMTGGSAGISQININGTLTNPTAAAQTATYTVTPTSGTCVGSSFTVVETVNPSPVYALTKVDPTVCGATDGSITITGLLASTSYTITYSDDAIVTPLGSVMSTLGGTYVISTLNAGSYTNFIVALNSTGCSTSNLTGISLVNPGAPDVFDIADQVICGANYTLPTITGTSLTGTQSYYSGINGTGTAYAAGAVISSSMTMYIYDNLAGCTDQENFLITINIKPIIANKTANSCTAVVFTVSPLNVLPDVVPALTTYDWGVPVVTGGMTGGAAGVSAPSISGTITNSTSTSQTATYTVTATNTGCSGLPFTVIVTVNPYPSIPAQVANACSASLFTNTPANGVPTALTIVPVGTTYTWLAPVVTGGMTGGLGGVAATSITGTLTNATLLQQTATYTVTPTVSGCTGVDFTTTVSVDPPATNVLSSVVGTDAQTICVNTPLINITYAIGGSATSASITAGALPTGVVGSFVAGVFTISGTPSVAGPYSYTVTSSGGFCTGVSLSGTITVNSPPTISLLSALLTDAQVVCNNTAITNITYTIGGSTTGASISAGALPVGVVSSYSAGVFTISGTPTVAGPYSYTVTTSGGACVPAVSLSGTITVDPAATNVLSSVAGTSTQTICVNTPLINITYAIGGSATSASITTGALPLGVTGSFAAGVFTISGTPSVVGPYSYTVTSSGGSCAGISLSGTITVDSPPTISLFSALLTDAQVVCNNTAITNITYTIGGSTTGASITAGALPAGVVGSYLAGVYTISGTPTVAGPYSYTVTTSGGTCVPAVSLSGTVNVTIAPTLTLTSAVGTDSQNICFSTLLTDITYIIGGGATGVSMTAGALPAGVSGVFNGGTGVYTISGTPSTAIGSPFSYTLTTTGGGCTAATSLGTIGVVSQTVDLSSLPFTNAQSICLGNAITDITYTVAGGATGALVVGLPTGLTGTYLAGVYTINGTPTQTGNFIYTVTSTGPCGGAISIGTISINSVILNNIPGLDSTICSGSSITLVGGVVTGGNSSYTYLWQSSLTPVGPFGNAAGINNTSNYTTSLLNVDTYFIRIVTSGGCVDTSENTIPATLITINPQPTAVAGGNATICSNGTVIVSGASATNGNILWTHNGFGTLTSATTLTPTYTPVIADAGTSVTLTMTVTGLSSCNTTTATASYIVDVTPLPTAVAGGISSVCANGGPVNILGAISTNGTILWTHNGAGTLINMTTISPSYTPALGDAGNTVLLTMTVTSSISCTPGITAVASYSITVNNLPTVALNAGVDDTLSLGNSVTLNPSGSSIISWNWLPALNLDNANAIKPIATPTVTTIYELTGVDINGCSMVDSVTIVVIKDYSLIISNMMSPNGDGKNDTWGIENIENYPNTEVIIVNREGQIVFESMNYANTWDGKYNGKNLPDATYYYIVKFATSDKVYKGAVTLLHGSK